MGLILLHVALHGMRVSETMAGGDLIGTLVGVATIIYEAAPGG